MTKYGRRELTAATLIVGGAVAVLAVTLGGRPALFWPPTVLLAILLAWVLWFFRDPDRTPSDDLNAVISPADGRVADITPLGADSLLGVEGVQIGIFMNVFNVHVNRSPFDGEVTGIEHKSGAFLDVRDPAAREKNESTTIHLQCNHANRPFPMIVRQVAGLVARRIVTDLAIGRCVERGQRIGMIKFGSRLEVLVPKEVLGEVCVSIGQKVFAGTTTLATLTSGANA